MAQIITGTVTDGKNGDPLVGVSVKVKGTAAGVITDVNGNYSIELPSNAPALVFTFVGYAEKEIPVSEIKSPLNVELEETEVDLEQVVISGSKREEKILHSPSAISVVNASQINNSIPINHFKNIEMQPGVDIIPTGLVGGNVVTRGFNNVFSGSLFTAVDNRIGSVPSLRVNAFQLIPTSTEDIERIEVVKGPASALYGPNAASGVVHIITKSPLDMKEKFKTKATLAYGIEGQQNDSTRSWSDRDVWSANLWHAGQPHKKFGYKISGNYFNGDDWPYDDPAEPDSVYVIRPTAEGNDTIEGPVDNSRNNLIRSYSIDSRIDYRIRHDMELILSSGSRNGSNVEMTGLGASQVINWKYIYAQARFLWKDLFAQFYSNFSNSGDTRLLRSGSRVIDKSKLLVIQLQHSYKPIKQIRFTYGFDALLTRPNTDRTLYGKYEDDDNINELGLYLQGDFDVQKKLSLVGAVRGDYHTFVDDIFFSPRAAIVYKPNEKHTLRATYNRAFDSPGSTNLSLDVIQGYIPYVNIPIMAEGNRNGFNYQYVNNPFIAENPLLPQYLSPLATDPSAYQHLNDPNMNQNAWTRARQIVIDQFNQALAEAGQPAIAGVLVDSIVPMTIDSVMNVVKTLNLTTFSFEQAVDPAKINSIKPLTNAVTQSYEIGYKGMLFDRLMLTVDAYRVDKKRFISAIKLVSPSVFLDSAMLQNEIADAITLAIYGPTEDSTDDINLFFGLVTPETLVEFLDQNPAYGNFDGRADDEFIRLFTRAGSSLPFGSVTPVENTGGEMILSYNNIGDLTVYGIDIGATFFVTKDLRFGAAYSWMSKDTIHDEDAQFGYIALNAPQNKVALSASYNAEKIGLEAGLRWRWQQSFHANSGVYVGYVDAYNVLDLNLTCKLWFSKNTELTLSIQNLIGGNYRPFPGAPEIGRLTMLRLAHEF
ncbi:MAG TPA: TonB-dependent receptor [Chitinophagales bacterium]|nr:TonB-dependent receptor [Chitinophagales bacterium]